MFTEGKNKKQEQYLLFYQNEEISEEIPCRIVRSNRKSYGISVDENGAVTLRLPLRGSIRVAQQMAEEKKDWIYQKVCQQRERAAQRRQAQEEQENRYTPQQRAALEKRYRQAAKEYFPQRAAFYADRLGVTFGKIRIAEQKTRWGSCSSNGTLSFNWKLMLAPPRVLDYVVVHEVCHLKEMNHSPRFWAYVEQLMPEYKEYRKWLRENGQTLGI
jgi:hypothetical protein